MEVFVNNTFMRINWGLDNYWSGNTFPGPDSRNEK